MATIQELGQKVKLKYPGSYDDLDDIELGQRIKQKYPGSYDDFTDITIEAPKRSFLSKATRIANAIFPGKQVGESIGTLAGYALSPHKQQYDISGPKPSQVAGDIAQGALTVGTLGGAGTTGKFASRLFKTTGLGAGFGASSALKEGDPSSEIAKQAGIGAALGGGLSLAGAGISKIGKIVSENIPNWLIKSLGAEKDITQHVLQNTKLGTTNSILKRTQSNISNLDSQINKILESDVYRSISISRKNLLKSVAQSYGQTGGGGTLNSEEIAKIIIRVAPQAKGLLSRETLTLSDANRLRKIIDQTLGAKFFLKAQAPFNKEVLGSFNSFLRNLVKDSAKETIPLFAEESKEITLRNAINISQKRFARIGLYEIVSGLGGYGLGGIPGAAAAVAGEKILRSPATAIGVAKTLGKTRVLKSGIQKITPLLRTSILKSLNENNLQ